jgi:hypothetical protein
MALDRDRLDHALDAYACKLQEAARHFEMLSGARGEQLTAQLLESLDRFKESRRGAADAVADSIMAILAQVLASGAPPLLQLGLSGLAGAVLAAGGEALAKGEDYNWVSSQVAFDLTAGLADAPACHIGANQLTDVLALGQASAERAARLTAQILKEEGEDILISAETLERQLSNLMLESIASGRWELDFNAHVSAVPGTDKARLVVKAAMDLAVEIESRAFIRQSALRYALAGALGASDKRLLPAAARTVLSAAAKSLPPSSAPSIAESTSPSAPTSSAIRGLFSLLSR